MSDETKTEDVNTDDVEVIQTDNVTDDHDAGVGSSANELESHQLDIDDYDEVIDNADKLALGDTSGETKTTDDLDADEGKSTDDDEAKIPKSRLDEVIAERNTDREALATEKAERAKEKAFFEGRLQALEIAGKPVPEKTEPEVSPFDKILAGEPQEIIDALQANPAEFFQSLKESAEAKAQANITVQQEEKAYYDTLRNGLDKFAVDHDGFMDNLEKMGMVVDNDPIHNLVSAFAYEVEIPAMKAAHEEALVKATGDLEAAKAEGIKVGKAEALKEFTTKGSAAVLDGSQSVDGAKVNNPELVDTEKSGGLAAILTKKLLARRAGKG